MLFRDEIQVKLDGLIEIFYFKVLRHLNDLITNRIETTY